MHKRRLELNIQQIEQKKHTTNVTMAKEISRRLERIINIPENPKRRAALQLSSQTQ